MRTISVEHSLNGLKDALLANRGLDYFDEITAAQVTINGDNYYRTSLTKNGTTITIDVYSGARNAYRNLKIDGVNLDALNSDYSISQIHQLVVCDSALVINTITANGTPYYGPIIIYKTQKGYTAMCHGFYKGDETTGLGPGYNQINYRPTTTRVYIIDDEGTKTMMDTVNVQNNRDDNILTTSPIPGKVDVAKDVYYVVNRPFFSIAQPFMLDIGDVSYASFACNTILIKTS